ncbi:MAG TPA: dihydroorotase, partial [Parasegetibacter sp.]
SVGSNGLMHEGIISTQLGLPGKPALAEELMVERDIKLADYTQSKLHFTGISSARSLELIKNAKEKGIQVTCSVTPYHLLFTEDDLKSYDTNLKVNPPLRGKEDRDALAEGVKSGLIDAICSHHLPQDIDHKTVEFEYAENGMNILQITYSLLKKALPGIKEETIVNLLSKKPREIFGFAPVTVQKDQPAQLTLFNPEAEFTFTKSRNRSKSVNNPFLDSNFIGAAIGIINGKQVYLNS